MSQLALAHSERIAALMRLGYTSREAAFLVLAALQSGYFLRRQYCRFIDKEVGGTAASLIDKLLANHHAAALEGCHNTKVYHVNARPFYAVLGQEDNRNRRLRPPVVIKNKLMCLDVMLDFAQRRCLTTEQEKVDYFTQTLGVLLEDLPTKEFRSPTAVDPTARYFVDKFPIFASEDGIVSFCFVDEGTVTCGRFESYLKQYARLFARLAHVELIYAAPSNTLFKQAQQTFERLCFAGRSVVERLDIERLLIHFEDRRCYESGSLEAFDRSRIIRMRNDRQTFQGRSYDVLFEGWKAKGERAVRATLSHQKPSADNTKAIFKTHLLTGSYDIFGSRSRSHDAA